MKSQYLRKLPLLILLLILFVIGIVFFTVKKSGTDNQFTEMVHTSIRRVVQLSNLRNAIQYHSETTTEYSNGNDSFNTANVDSAKNLLSRKLDSAKSIFSNDPDDSRIVDSLSIYINKRVDLAAEVISIGKSQGLKKAALFLQNARGYRISNKAFAYIRELQENTILQLDIDKNQNRKSHRWQSSLLVLFYLLTLLDIFIIARLFFFDFFVNKRLEKKLRDYNRMLEENVAQKTAEIRKNEERYRHLVEQASEAIFITNKEGAYLEVNEYGCELLGLSRKELMSMNVIDFGVFENDQAFHALHKRLENGENARNEYKVTRKDGSLVHLESSSKILSDGNVLSIVRNVTERRLMEEELRASEFNNRMVIENKIMGVVWSTPDGMLLNANKAFCNMMGCNLEDMKGKNFNDFTYPEDIASGLEHIELMKKGEIDNYVGEKRYVNKKGEIFWIELNRSCYRNPTTGEVEFLITIFHNKQEQKKYENALKESETRLKQVVSSYTDVFYVIDKNYRIILINEVAEKSLAKAWGKEVKLGAHLLDLIPQGSTEPIKESFEKVFKGEIIKYELHLNIKDHPEWFYVTFFPVKDDRGNIVGASVVSKDISELKKIEEELRESNNRFELIARTTNDAIWEWNLETGWLWANENHQKIYGLTLSDPVPGQDVWLSRIHPEDKHIIVRIQDHALISDKNTYSSEYRLLVEGKGYRNFLDRGYIIRNESGKPVRLMGSMMDITELKEAETAIRESEVKYRTFFENSMDGILFTSPEGDILTANAAACEIFQMSESEICSLGRDGIVDQTDPNLGIFLEERRREGKSRVELRMIRKDGTKFDSDLTSVVFNDAVGKKRTSVIFRDISERKQMERELRESESKFKSLVEESLVGVYIIQDGKFAYVNPRLAELLGYQTTELINTLSVLEVIHPDYRKLVADNIRLRLSGVEQSIHYEVEAIKKNGEVIQAELFGSLTEYRGAPAIIGSTVDISHRKKAIAEIKKARELAEQIIDSLPGIFFLINEEGIFLRWNKQFEEVSGYKAYEVVKKKPWQFFEGEEREYIKNKIKDIIVDGLDDAEAGFVTKDHTRIPYYFKAIGITYENQKCLLGYGIDISDRKRAEEDLAKSYTEIRRLSEYLQNIREEERKHIAREIHDELGQQITVLKMDASWLNKKLKNADESVKNKLNDLIELMDSTVKTVRRISSELRPSLLDDMGLIPAMEWYLKDFGKRIAIKTNFSIPKEELNLPDEARTGLFRIFQESLTNIARHSKAKKVDVSLQVVHGNIVMAIKDDGDGFDPESVKSKKTLGILGMKERSFMMGGTYEVKSKPGKGTRVMITVPYHEKIVLK